MEEIPGIIHILHPLINLLVEIGGREGNEDFAGGAVASVAQRAARLAETQEVEERIQVAWELG